MTKTLDELLLSMEEQAKLTNAARYSIGFELENGGYVEIVYSKRKPKRI